MSRAPTIPPQRLQTLRQMIRESLASGQPYSLLELSAEVGASEREVGAHLQHLRRSLRRAGHRLRMEPARCLGCGFVFRDRQRLTRPGRCPRCRRTRISHPRFSLREVGGR